MLTALSLESFKAFAKARIPLQPFTMLIGPNGAGKSTILQAIDLLGGLVTSSVPEYLQSRAWEYADLPHLRARNVRLSISAELDFSGSPVVWGVALGARRFAGIAGESVQVVGGQELLGRAGRNMWRWNEQKRTVETIQQTLTSSWLSTLDVERDASNFPVLVEVARWARGVQCYFFLDPLKLRAPGRGEPSGIGLHGEFLAPFLARLRERDRERFDRLIDRVREHYPRLIALHPKRTQYGWTQLEVTEKWNNEKATFNARQVSDGLLRLIAVAAMYEQPESPSVLLLDEIENGLHPHLLGAFIGMLQAFVKQRAGKSQVIVATHSPLAVNFCESPDAIILVARGRGGQPRVVPLDSTHGFQRLRRHFDHGELWYNLGEDKLIR
ncbi:MAG: AAA family ATPase [Acidobacteriota bacterium]